MVPAGKMRHSKNVTEWNEKKYLLSLYEEMGRGFIVLNRRNQIMECNKSFVRLLGFPESKLIGAPLSKITPAQYRKLHTRAGLELKKTNKAQQYEGQLRKKDGTDIPVMLIRSRFKYISEVDYLVIYDISGRMEILAELAVFREKCQQVFESSFDGMFLLDENGIIKTCNTAFEKICKVNRNEIIGRPYTNFIQKRDVKRASKNLKNRMKGNIEISEYEVGIGDGSLIQVEVLTHATKNPDGSMDYFGTLRDISERKKILNQLSKSEETHKTLVENAEEMMLIQSFPDGKILYANPKCDELFELKKSPPYLGTFLQYVHPEDRGLYRDVINNLGTTPKKMSEYAFRIRTKKNGIRYVSASSVLLGGKKSGGRLISVLRDITEQRYLENKLRSSEDRFRNLFDHANDLILIFDAKGNILDCNKRVETMTGYSRHELLEMSFFNLYDVPGTESDGETPAAYIFPARIDLPEEMEIARKDGGVIQVEFVLTRMYDNEGDFVSYLSVARDISERKRLHDQLLQAEKLSSLGELISGVAHELNNPLSVVLGCSELIVKSKDLPQHLETKSRLIINGASRCAKIIENMISFARKKELYKEYINIHDVLDKALELHTYPFKVNNVEVEINFTNKPFSTMADPVQLQQVFLNLINNASDSISETGRKGRLFIRTVKEKTNIRIEISDNGSGIPSDIRNRIFDPFYTTKEVGKGTGLGLSVSYGIIKEHGGDLFLDKSYRGGAKFIITLPVLKAERGRRTPASISRDMTSSKGKRILIIDSDEAILGMCEEILFSEGHIVETVSDGKNALALIKGAAYDAIILDILLDGDIGGKELLYQIKVLYPGFSEKIVLLTMESISPEIQRFLADQKLISISKPFHTKDLLDAVESIS